MTIDRELESSLEDETYRQVRKKVLAEVATACRPRMFAIHGLCRNPEHPDILGWGLEFPDGVGAIYTEPPSGGMHTSETAERVLQVMSIIGDVQLTWLDCE
jgi:hypothetical protein